MTQNQPPNPPVAEPIWTAKVTWTRWHTLGLLAIVIAIIAIGLWTPPTSGLRVWIWLGTLVLMTIGATVAGHGIIGRWSGLLIDERNRMSLSRLQMILWTVLVLSGFLTAALSNIAVVRAGVKNIDPLSIAIPFNLLMLMGISATSLVGSPLIKSIKTAEPLAATEEQNKQIEAEKDRTLTGLESQNLPKAQVDIQGKIVIWKSPWDARFADLFQGDEIGNAAQFDLGKVQMFYFTLILVLIYAVALGSIFITSTSIIADFPKLDDGMVTLLGISHAGYLVNKVIPHSLG